MIFQFSKTVMSEFHLAFQSPSANNHSTDYNINNKIRARVSIHRCSSEIKRCAIFWLIEEGYEGEIMVMVDIKCEAYV